MHKLNYLVIIAVLWTNLSFAGDMQQKICDESVLPQFVRVVMKSKIPSWRVVKIDDLDQRYQDLWRQAHPAECPGFTWGFFESKTRLSYAVLLIPQGSPKPGYRLIVVSKTKKGGVAVRVLERIDDPATSQYVIAKLPPGKYDNIYETLSVKIELDGIQMELLEVGAILFYWKAGRFQELIISE
jgi:hypothetical protein